MSPVAGDPLDPRLTPARPDLAAAFLRGRVEAERFSEGERFLVVDGVLDLKRRPRHDAPLETQLLFGETVIAYEEEDGWSWVQAERDGYVGYVASSGLGQMRTTPPTHRVAVGRTHVYPGPDMKIPAVAALPLDARVVAGDARNGFFAIEGRGYVFADHLAPVDSAASDPVAVAEGFVGCPYLWGGKSMLGIDCSGLVQVAFSVCGRIVPRDTDMQERIGEAVDLRPDLSGLQRGDLVFWKGHVGLMIDGERLIHANGFHMLVRTEPVRVAQARIFAVSRLPLTSIRRMR